MALTHTGSTIHFVDDQSGKCYDVRFGAGRQDGDLFISENGKLASHRRCSSANRPQPTYALRLLDRHIAESAVEKQAPVTPSRYVSTQEEREAYWNLMASKRKIS